MVNFPKAEKFALSERIKVEFLDLIGYIESANSVRSKRKHYAQEADGHLQRLKVVIRLAKSQKYISKGFYHEIDAELTEINKMLSGFIRSASRK